MDKWEPLPPDEFVPVTVSLRTILLGGRTLNRQPMPDEYAFCRRVQVEEPKPYSHRNGERVWPEMIGAFWVEHFDGKLHPCEFFVSPLTGQITTYDQSFLPATPKIYGPIVPPEEDEDA